MSNSNARPRDANAVFLVDGRNHPLNGEFRTLLASFGLTVIGWEDAIAATGTASPHCLLPLPGLGGTLEVKPEVTIGRR